jgi:endonuclease/exonuclease/phosphatase family metal-dependent hydrolase
VNTHLDHVGQVAQSRGADLILARIAELRGGLPVVLTGDLNVTPDHPVVAKLTDVESRNRLIYAKEVARQRTGIDGTWHDFGKIAEDSRECIDYVFVDEERPVLAYDVLPDRLDGVFLSDHVPVLAKLLI